MKKAMILFIIILFIIIEVLISTIVLVLKDSVIIGNYKEGSEVYNIVSDQKNLPRNATIKCIIKNRFVFRDITYTVYYKTDRIYSTNISLELTNSYDVSRLNNYAVGVIWYCVLVILFIIVIFFIIKKGKNWKQGSYPCFLWFIISKDRKEGNEFE